MRNTLTPKQQRFVEEYCVDLNATAAAKRAGYKNAEVGRQVITNPNVSKYIQVYREKLKNDSKRTTEKILDEIEKRGQMALEAGHYGPSIKALELIGKYLGMFIERQESTGILKIIVERHD